MTDSTQRRPHGDTVRAASLLAAPLLWLLVVYVGALAALLVTSFYGIDSFTNQVVAQIDLHLAAQRPHVALSQILDFPAVEHDLALRRFKA